jgi:hypothetical protein
MTPSITKAPILQTMIKFLYQQKIYLRVKHFIKKGEINAPTAPPSVNTPIKNPFIVDF